MSSTNKTAELHLSQFIGTDIPSILTDYNGDMQKIDAGVREVKQATAGAVSDLSSVTARVTNAEQDISGLNSTVQGIATRVVTVEGDIDTLQSRTSQIESVIPNNASTSNKLATIDDIGGSGAITELEARVTTAEENIEELENVVGKTTLIFSSTVEQYSSATALKNAIQTAVSNANIDPAHLLIVKGSTNLDIVPLRIGDLPSTGISHNYTGTRLYNDGSNNHILIGTLDLNSESLDYHEINMSLSGSNISATQSNTEAIYLRLSIYAIQ